jgi:hypothetical protein
LRLVRGVACQRLRHGRGRGRGCCQPCAHHIAGRNVGSSFWVAAHQLLLHRTDEVQHQPASACTRACALLSCTSYTAPPPLHYLHKKGRAAQMLMLLCIEYKTIAQIGQRPVRCTSHAAAHAAARGKARPEKHRCASRTCAPRGIVAGQCMRGQQRLEMGPCSWVCEETTVWQRRTL